MKTAAIGMLLLAASSGALAQKAEQIFERADSLYQQGNVAEARDLYESILHNGYVSGELYYNLGNAYYRLGNIPFAILNYERAARLMPNDDDLQHNLSLARLRLTDRIEPAPRLFIWDYWDDVKNAFSLTTLTWLAYAGFLILVGSIAWIVLARSYAMRKLGLLGAAGGALFLIVFLVLLAARISDLRSNRDAIVVASIATVKNSPDPKSSDAFVVHGGVKVQVTDRVGTWLMIRLADGKVGWLEDSTAIMI